MRRTSQLGVTLLELLIAVTLVSLITVGVLMAMRVGLNAMEKANSRLLSNRRATGVQRIMERQIGGLMPVVAECQADPGVGPRRSPFFQGEPQRMRFVSSYSLTEASRGYPRILEFTVIPGENNEGVRLVVNELLYAGPVSTGVLCFGPRPEGGTAFVPIEVGPQSFVLGDRLAFCRFAFQERAGRDLNEMRWVSRWTDEQLPAAIRIEMGPLEPDPSRLPLLTLTVPVRVNKNPMMPYTDQQYVIR